MCVILPTEHHLEFLSLKGGCTGSSESTLVKMPHCWKSHVMAFSYQIILSFDLKEILFFQKNPNFIFFNLVHVHL